MARHGETEAMLDYTPADFAELTELAWVTDALYPSSAYADVAIDTDADARSEDER